MIIKRASAEQRAIGWSWDCKMLETLHDETRSVDGYENSMEAIDSLLTRLGEAGCLVIAESLPDNAEISSSGDIT